MRIRDFEEEEISQFSKDLKETFSWFDFNFSSRIFSSSSEFWDEQIGCRLASVCENVNILVTSDEYFVTQIRLNKEISVFIRLSKQVVKTLLEGVLGLSKKAFNIEKLTELEAMILTEFNNFVYNRFEDLILTGADLPKKITSYDECSMTYFLKDSYESIGKMIITIPLVAIKPEKILLRQDVFSIEDFTESKGEVDIEVGKTRIKLNDLKQLEAGDVVLLEKSHASQMAIKFDGKRKSFRVAPNPSLIIDYEVNNDNGGSSMDDIYNMWDTIQVEMGAEFEKVKLSLGELKQISEGLVVDVGSVYDNKIDLKVDEKIIASGELVIINDRYGVRINEIFTEEKNNASQIAQNMGNVAEYENIQQPPADETPVPTQEEGGEFNEEDFDYSDFDVDEEDL